MLTDDGVALPIYNVFEQVTEIDEIDKIKEIMIKSGAEYALMSGSGPSVFCCCKDADVAETVQKNLVKKGFFAYSCQSVYPEEFI